MTGLKLRVLVAMAMVLAACAPAGPAAGSAAPAKSAGTLRVAIGSEIDTLDPVAQATATVSQLVDMIGEKLVSIDPKTGASVPVLATKLPEVSADNLTYTFTLRSGVKFHDGSDFNAAAVKFSFDRINNPNTFKVNAGPFKVVDTTTVIDDTHVQVRLKSPFAAFVAALNQTAGSILSPASVDAQGNTAAQIIVPVGTGPYKFKERVKGDHLTFERFDGYWGTKPTYQYQEFKIVPEIASREALLRAGQVDVIVGAPLSDIPTLKSDPSLTVVTNTSSRTTQIVLDTASIQQPLLKNVQVRQALNYAVDKATIVDRVLHGVADVLDAPLPKTVFGYCQVGAYAYDPVKAKAMLQAAGAAGMTLKMASPTGVYPEDIKVAQAVAGYLRDVGVNVVGPSTMDNPSFLAAVMVTPEKATFDIHLLGWAPGYLDAAQSLIQFVSAESPPKGQESSHYKNDEVDMLMARAGSTADPEKRKADYCAVAKQVWADAPWIFLFNDRVSIVHLAKVTGVGTFPTGKIHTVYAAPK